MNLPFFFPHAAEMKFRRQGDGCLRRHATHTVRRDGSRSRSRIHATVKVKREVLAVAIVFTNHATSGDLSQKKTGRFGPFFFVR
ncbi:MAG TPA: hypothetical protein VGE12_18965 [Noviherbaspirillum sp.]